ncbi:MAG: hypothetical protein HRF40_03175 [Nitrososphaera sp.]
MAKTEAIFIGGSIAIGAAILGVLFLLYPDFMFAPSASSSGTEVTGSAETPLVSPQDETTTIAEDTPSTTDNTTNSTSQDSTASYSATQ